MALHFLFHDPIAPSDNWLSFAPDLSQKERLGAIRQPCGAAKLANRSEKTDWAATELENRRAPDCISWPAGDIAGRC
jgi:hypothetical protein